MSNSRLRLGFILGAALATGLTFHACRATVRGAHVWVPPAALACHTDSDCVVSDTPDRCCEPCPTEAYAISVEGREAMTAPCNGVECPATDCEIRGLPGPDQFMAICKDGICKRRSKN
jgi:hypothetical protein